MNNRHLTIEHALYLVAVGLALLMRLAQLGAAPLSDYEATHALHALGVARGSGATLGTQPGYSLFTGLLFFLLGSSDALARLFPALVGGLLAGLPFLFRHHLGRPAALILAFSLALDPGLVAVSRLAGGPGLALTFVLLAVAAWFLARPALAGIFSALAFLSGPSALTGVVGLVLVWGLGQVLGAGPVAGTVSESEISAPPPGYPERPSRTWLIALGLTLLLAGTLFLRYPQGLGALGSAIPAYLAGWLEPSQVQAARLGLALLAYQPLAIGFGLVGGVRAWLRSDPVGRWISLWSLAALALIAFYPGRQVSDLAWALIPIWALAARELARHLVLDLSDGWVVAAQAGLIVVLAAFIWINLAGLAGVPAGTQGAVLRWLVIGGVIGLGALTSMLIALGWSTRVGLAGLTWGLTAAFTVYAVGSTYGFVDPGSGRAQSWWYPQPITVDEELLLRSLGDLSEWHTGRRDAVEVVLTAPSPSLDWYLRDFPNARQEDQLGAGELPAVVITRGEAGAQLPELYRGTDLLWWGSPVWEGARQAEWMRWLVFRQGVTQPDHITLWARNDLFPDDSLSAKPEGGPPSEGVSPFDEPVQ